MTRYPGSTENSKHVLILFFMVIGLVFFSALSAAAAEKSVPRISVIGEGTVNIAPDLAMISLGVTREAPTAREALDQNNAAMNKVIDAMKEAGIAEKDLQTSNFSIQPRYVHHRPKNNEQQKPPVIVGYSVSNSLSVRIRDLSRLGEIIDRSITLGVNTGGNIQFGNDNPQAAITKARSAAMKSARDKAETLVEAAGVKLGPILEINENSHTPGPVPMAQGRMMAEAAMADSVPVEGGQNSYSIIVSAIWQIEE